MTKQLSREKTATGHAYFGLSAYGLKGGHEFAIIAASRAQLIHLWGLIMPEPIDQDKIQRVAICDADRLRSIQPK